MEDKSGTMVLSAGELLICTKCKKGMKHPEQVTVVIRYSLIQETLCEACAPPRP